ncbi:hypothetical protein CLAFUW4_04489 [Fulvia fulva]|uniref:Myb-like domain-containing protein n=1 Tax=Passalora fulva TaxID=5499 RepID=A0A9Q8LGA6_PASFU|nr:uncharacterized protein CLAFUR5_04454 [Fulvia fulva]KAK4626331.1 hypothetical protein CLAFUR4_04475 [Fulvia fulva]KAK4628289.1 hypothetical protein CLAFUR0_04478 [Fulvia fulva]UJO16659.1 hypothetical protein CLAFUR5_04454 [Fulvia fulva]WPV13218.1 hypothetical protein CLAFUW4_04489 [Fulvia fulva]WPV28994.1 hypothetical protein CLAFUW7_04481 [Fulvia fulva]
MIYQACFVHTHRAESTVQWRVRCCVEKGLLTEAEYNANLTANSKSPNTITSQPYDTSKASVLSASTEPKPKRTGGHQGSTYWSADEDNIVVSTDTQGLGPKETWRTYFSQNRTYAAVRKKHDYLRRKGRLLSDRNRRAPMAHPRAWVSESMAQKEV